MGQDDRLDIVDPDIGVAAKAQAVDHLDRQSLGLGLGQGPGPAEGFVTPELADGAPHHQLVLALALGHQPIPDLMQSRQRHQAKGRQKNHDDKIQPGSYPQIAHHNHACFAHIRANSASLAMNLRLKSNGYSSPGRKA